MRESFACISVAAHLCRRSRCAGPASARTPLVSCPSYSPSKVGCVSAQQGGISRVLGPGPGKGMHLLAVLGPSTGSAGGVVPDGAVARGSVRPGSLVRSERSWINFRSGMFWVSLGR